MSKKDEHIINDLINIINSLFNNEIDELTLNNLLSNFKGISILKSDIDNVGSYTIDGTIYISKSNLKRIDYLLHELFHVILHDKIPYGLEEAICEYVATLYRNKYNIDYESYAYYAQVNILEQIDYLYKSEEYSLVVSDIINNIDNYKNVLLKVYNTPLEVEEVLSSLDTLTSHDYYMTWNTLSLEEESKVYEEHDTIYERITELNKSYTKENNKVFTKYL